MHKFTLRWIEDRFEIEEQVEADSIEDAIDSWEEPINYQHGSLIVFDEEGKDTIVGI